MSGTNDLLTRTSSPLSSSWSFLSAPLDKESASEAAGTIPGSQDHFEPRSQERVGVPGQSAAALRARAGADFKVPRFFTRNMELLRGDFSDEAGSPWDGTGEPYLLVHDLNEPEVLDGLRALVGTPKQATPPLDAAAEASLEAIVASLEGSGAGEALLVKASLLQHLYRHDPAQQSMVNLKGAPVAYIDGGIRPFNAFEFSGATASLPVAMTLPAAEVEAVQALARRSGRWEELSALEGFGEGSLDYAMMTGASAEDTGEPGLWVLQVVSNTTGGRHPWLRIVAPDGRMMVVGFGYMDKKPSLGNTLTTMAKGRFAAIDPNERKQNPKKVTNLPMSSRQARQVMDSVLSYQRRLLDCEQTSESGPAFHLLQQNCAAFVSGILAEVMDIHLTEARPDLHPRPTPRKRGLGVALKRVTLLPLMFFRGAGLMLVNLVTVPLRSVRGSTGERFRHSSLQLDRGQPLPADQGDWSGELRHVGSQGPMLGSFSDFFRLGATARWKNPFKIQRWQNTQASTQRINGQGHLRVVDLDAVAPKVP